MTAIVNTGTGNYTYTNATGGNVRVIVMSCKTESNTGRNGKISCGTAEYPLYPNITWGKGVIAPTAGINTNAFLQPVEYLIANGSSFKLEGATTGSPTGQQMYTTVSTTKPGLTGNWTVPSNVTSVCVVCVGAGAHMGPGGDLSWKNHIPVTPGSTVPYQVGRRGEAGDPDDKMGGDTWFKDRQTCFAPGGYDHKPDRIGDGGGTGVRGAGGYTGDGGAGGSGTSEFGYPGKGGGGGGQYSEGGGGGGGVGLMGQGDNGDGGKDENDDEGGGKGGSGGESAPSGNYGGGGAFDGSDRKGGDAGLRIIWGDGRAFPAYNTGDDETGDDTVIRSYNIIVIPEGN